MSYIDLERPGATYRLILNRHNKAIDPKQLPDNYEVLLLEGRHSDERFAYASLTGDPRTGVFYNTYGKIIDEAKEQRSLIAAAEPINFPNTLQVQVTGLTGLFLKNPGFLFRFIRVLQLGGASTEIKSGDRNFRAIESSMQQYRSHFPKSGLAELRDVIMAQRAFCLANQLKEHQASPTRIVLAAGLWHMNILKELELDPKERIAKICDYPNLRQLYPLEKFSKIQGLIYEPKRGLFLPMVFEDQQLRAALRKLRRRA